MTVVRCLHTKLDIYLALPVLPGAITGLKSTFLCKKNIAASSRPSQINLSLLCCQSRTVFLIVLIDSRTDLLEAEFEAAGLKKYRVEVEEATLIGTIICRVSVTYN